MGETLAADTSGIADTDGLTSATFSYPESTEGRPWGQPLKKPEGAPQNLG